LAVRPKVVRYPTYSGALAPVRETSRGPGESFPPSLAEIPKKSNLSAQKDEAREPGDPRLPSPKQVPFRSRGRNGGTRFERDGRVADESLTVLPSESRVLRSIPIERSSIQLPQLRTSGELFGRVNARRALR